MSPAISAGLDNLILKLAKENRSWGYDWIVESLTKSFRIKPLPINPDPRLRKLEVCQTVAGGSRSTATIPPEFDPIMAVGATGGLNQLKAITLPIRCIRSSQFDGHGLVSIHRMAILKKVSIPLSRLASSVKGWRERHRARRQPTEYGFAFADRIAYLDPERWKQATQHGSIFLRSEILKVIEGHGPENLRCRYSLIFRENIPVAALVAQVLTVSGDRVQGVKGKSAANTSLWRKVLGSAAGKASTKFRERVLVAGNVLCWGCHGVAFAPGEDASSLWAAVAEALFRIRRAERLNGQTDFVMIKDLASGEARAEALRRFSYRPVETEPNMVLTIDESWRSYDDYLAALGAKYRRNSKDQMKKLAAAGCVVEPLHDLSPHAARLHDLYLSVQRNASVRLATLPATYLPALAQAAGQDFRCSVIRRGDEILGFVTSLRDGDTAIGYYIGFDREAAAAGTPLYLRLLHATINDAISWRCKRLSLGRTALEPKAALGAKPEPMSVWIRHRVPAVNWLVRGVLDMVPHAEAPERDPFKSKSDAESNRDAANETIDSGRTFAKVS